MLKLFLTFLSLAAGAFALGFNRFGFEMLAAAGIIYAASLLPNTTRHRRSYGRGSPADELYRRNLRDGHDA